MPWASSCSLRRWSTAVPCSMNEFRHADAVHRHVLQPCLGDGFEYGGAEPSGEHVLFHRHYAADASRSVQQQIDVEGLCEDRVNHAA